MSKILVYVHDPMCSWCWGFEPTRRAIVAGLPADMQLWRLLGGLAPDSEQPMPEPMRAALQQTWCRIEAMIPGTRFNFDFWTNNTPRRSTYPANRAVIAARLQGEGYDSKMTGAIQRAYYLEARNPSDDSTLIELAAEIELDVDRFALDLAAESTHAALLDEITRARTMGIDSFPSLAVLHDGALRHIGLDYGDPGAMLRQIEAA
jgi:putative protein-disulfide isomerase